MLVNADEKTMELVEFEQLEVGDDVFVVTTHKTGQTFIAQGQLKAKDYALSWKSDGLTIVAHPSVVESWIEENRKIYRKKFVFPEAWGSVVSVYDEELREDRRFVRLTSSWIREVDSTFYTEDQLRKFYPGKFTIIRDGV